jgi:hypothetical protein
MTVISRPTPLIPGFIHMKAFYRDDDSIDQVVGVQLLLDALQMHRDRSLSNALFSRNVLDRFSHKAPLHNSGLSCRQKRAGAGLSQSLTQARQHQVKRLEAGATRFLGRQRDGTKYKESLADLSSSEAVLQPRFNNFLPMSLDECIRVPTRNIRENLHPFFAKPLLKKGPLSHHSFCEKPLKEVGRRGVVGVDEPKRKVGQISPGADEVLIRENRAEPIHQRSKLPWRATPLRALLKLF